MVLSCGSRVNNRRETDSGKSYKNKREFYFYIDIHRYKKKNKKHDNMISMYRFVTE